MELLITPIDLVTPAAIVLADLMFTISCSSTDSSLSMKASELTKCSLSSVEREIRNLSLLDSQGPEVIVATEGCYFARPTGCHFYEHLVPYHLTPSAPAP